MSDYILDNLPRLAQDYTPEQRQACVAFLASLSLAELRQRQSIKREEIARAVRGRLPEETIQSVQEMDQHLMDAVALKCAAEEAGFEQGRRDHANKVQLGDPEQIAAWAAASDAWKEGWGDGYERG